jgi:hypothetical protein
MLQRGCGRLSRTTAEDVHLEARILPSVHNLRDGVPIEAQAFIGHGVAVFYSPQGASFTVDKAIIKTPRVKESWFDPRYGVLHEMHTTDNLGYQTYQPPTSGRGHDWVLLLEGER